jgi:ElaB/YqjD/DUF883 family membrane-anchored ribosome-binding protein
VTTNCYPQCRIVRATGSHKRALLGGRRNSDDRSHSKEYRNMAFADSVRESARDELRALREQVNALMEDRITPAYEDASKRASAAAKRARSYTEDQADFVSGQVKDSPLIAIGVAAFVGFLFGRITK